MRKAIWAGAAALVLAGMAGFALQPARSSGSRSGSAAVARALRAFGGIGPRLSPRGDQIAFSYQGAIWRMPREGGAMKRLTSRPGFDREPAWSRDGQSIAYVNSTAGSINIIDSQKGTLQRSVPGVRAVGRLAFAADGKSVFGMFRSEADEYRSFPGRVDLASGKLAALAEPSDIGNNALGLSPDGARVIYACSPDKVGEQEGNEGPDTDLWLIPVTGGAPTKLGRIAAHVFQLWWAGDGQIYVSTDLGGVHNDLWSLAANDPAHGHKLTFGQADEEFPSVSADGRWLVYSDNSGSATAFVVRDLQTGEEKFAVPTRPDFGTPAGSLHMAVFEKGSDKPLVARVSVQEKGGGKFFAPIGSLYRNFNGIEHFYCDREADITLPAGIYTIRAFRGLEYRTSEQTVQIKAGATASARVAIERWTDPAARSLWSGESHVHGNYGRGEWYTTPDTARLQIEGEGLNVANMVVANSDGDAVFDREFFRGAPDPVSSASTILYWNEEYRATLWGHMTFLNLKHLVEPFFTGFPHTTNPWDIPTNGDVTAHVHNQGGVVNYTHPARLVDDPYGTAYSAKAMPVDVARGLIDSVDINSNGHFIAAVELWYKLLNCGFRLAASAGTDRFLNRVDAGLPGVDRAYVKIAGALSYQAWANGIRDGRAFVTNGPMLDLGVADHAPGDTLRLPSAASVPVHANATWHAPLDRVELVYNGQVAASGTAIAEVRLGESGWLSLRAYAANNIQAHTSPIYVEITGKKDPGSRAAANYFLTWIDRLEKQLKARDRLPGPAARAHVAAQLEAARAVYRKIAATGR